jgi:hypothetical protein
MITEALVRLPTYPSSVLQLTYPAPAWDFAQQDNAPPIPATAPPSRPPSRTDIRGPGQNTGYQDSIGTAPKGIMILTFRLQEAY